MLKKTFKMNSTIVSAYFKIPSKASHDTYMVWVRNFLLYTKEKTVFFTSEDLVEDLKKIRNENIIYEIMNFNDFISIKKYGMDFWEKHNKLDPEKYHTKELAIMWCEKKEFVLKVIEKNPFNTDIFVWCDAGCVRRDDIFHKIRTFGKNFERLDINKFNIQVIKDFCNKEFYTAPDVFIAGAIFVANKEKWLEYTKLYDEMLLNYDRNNICGNSDQYITASILSKNSNFFNQILPNKVYSDVWFLLLEDLSF
jgi:hypothetical protein